MYHLSSIINIILRIVNLCFSSSGIPASCKSAIISTLFKNNVWILRFCKTIGPFANLLLFHFIKAISTQIHSHLINNDIVDNYQSAYKTCHRRETALLRVLYNDIVTTIGRGNGAMLVLAAVLTPLIMIICFLYYDKVVAKSDDARVTNAKTQRQTLTRFFAFKPLYEFLEDTYIHAYIINTG